MSEAHTRLLAQVFEHLTGSTEKLPSAWVDEQVGRFDRTDGDIDTLAARIANVRTWTYITNRGDWVDDPLDRQQRARGIEDRLSDALHARLPQRFVDRRAAPLSRDRKGAVEGKRAYVRVDLGGRRFITKTKTVT